MSKRIDLPLQALAMEAEVVEEGVLLAWDLSLKNIIVESDAQMVVNSLVEQGQPSSSIHKVIEGTKMGLICFDSWEMKYINKKSNYVAHLIARYAKFITDCRIWVENTPPVIANQVLLDVNHLNISSN